MRLFLLMVCLMGFGATAVAAPRDDCLRKSGDEAIAACDEAIRINPRDAQSYTSRGYEFSQKGDHQRALADYDKSIAIDPNFPLRYINRAHSRAQLKQFDQAVSDCNQAIKLGNVAKVITGNGELNGFACRCEVYLEKGDFPKALLDCSSSISQYPKTVFAYALRARVYEGMGDAARAIADYQRALQSFPNSAFIEQRLKHLGAR